MSLWLAAEPLVLASKSAARRAIIEAAGIPLEIVAADIDERAIQARAGPHGPSDAAVMLAREKARAGGARIKGRFVAGADPTLPLGPARFTKPFDPHTAREPLHAPS